MPTAIIRVPRVPAIAKPVTSITSPTRIASSVSGNDPQGALGASSRAVRLTAGSTGFLGFGVARFGERRLRRRFLAIARENQADQGTQADRQRERTDAVRERDGQAKTPICAGLQR